MNETYLIDTHSHVDMLEEISVENAIKNAKDAGVKKILVPCASPKDLDKIYELVTGYEELYGLLGVHPSEVKDWDDSLISKIKEYSKSEKIAGIGEIGLDYYWDKEGHDLQRQWFIRQLELAREKNMPVIIHSREAAADTMEIMKQYAGGMKAVIHCYSYSPEMAREYVKMGYYIGVGGVVTFKNARRLKDTVKEIPLESIVLETDCPYLAPEPFRGKRNSSLNLPYIAKEIAEIKEISCENVVQQTEINARKLYNLEKGD